MIYIYPEQNLRAYPGTIRGTEEWDSTYKIRVNVEKAIHHFKDSFCVAGRKTQNEKTHHADLLLAGIAQLLTVMVADKLHKHQYIRSLKPLIAWALEVSYILSPADTPICFCLMPKFYFKISILKILVLLDFYP